MGASYKQCPNKEAHTPHLWSLGDVFRQCPGRQKRVEKKK